MHHLATFIPSVSAFILLFGVSQIATADSTVKISQILSDGTFPTASDTETWPVAPAGWSFARSYTAGGSTYLVLLRQHTGELDIHNLSGGAIGSRVNSYNLRKWWTSAELISPGGAPTLVLHDADTGSIRTYVLNADGSLGTRSDTANAAWQGKNLFSTYQRGSTWYFYGINTSTGSTALYTSTGTAVPTGTITAGWTSVDFVKLGSDTFRVLYKGGDFPGNQGGRLAIERIDASGNADLSVYAESASEAREGWTTVKFYTAGSNTYLLFYGASTSTPTNLRLEQFTGTGLTAITESPIDFGFTDFDTYASGGNTFMVALNEEGVERINGSEIDSIVESVQAQADAGTYGGYQFAIAQSGRVLYEHVYGLQDVANAIPMTSDVQMGFASLSKVFTTFSVLKLADMGELDLDTPIPNYLDYDSVPGFYQSFTVDPLFAHVTPRDYVLQTTGLDSGTYSGSCSAPDLASSSDLTGCLGSPAGSPVCTTPNTATGGLLCPRRYENANYQVARGIIEYLSLTEGTIEFVDYVQGLWMERVGMDGVDCMTPAGSQLVLYSCNTAYPCTSWTGTPQSDSANCGSGGWKASARQTLRYARAIRYEHVLGPELTGELMSTVAVTGGSTWAAWDGTVADDAATPETFYCKNGASGSIAELCVGTRSVDLFFARNNGPNVSGTWLVNRYNAGN